MFGKNGVGLAIIKLKEDLNIERPDKVQNGMSAFFIFNGKDVPETVTKNWELNPRPSIFKEDIELDYVNIKYTDTEGKVVFSEDAWFHLDDETDTE